MGTMLYSNDAKSWRTLNEYDGTTFEDAMTLITKRGLQTFEVVSIDSSGTVLHCTYYTPEDGDDREYFTSIFWKVDVQFTESEVAWIRSIWPSLTGSNLWEVVNG